jgi:CPA2 family monovalent cation:H+ antiporter-2
MELWTALLDILILLAAAVVLGGLCERFRQSPILGYLLSGTLLGPNAFDLLPSHTAVGSIAELGVALLLFSIGLEFSWRRLRAVGKVGGLGGTLQVLGTGALTTLVCLLAGLDVRGALAIGAVVPLSSTAAVIRLLAARAEVDAVHGRNAIGVLLLQDVAVVPLVLLVAMLGGEGSALSIGWSLIRSLGLAALLFASFHVVLNRLVPLVLGTGVAARNRDMPILLAIVTALGAAWVSHWLGFSPVLGAFLAGVLLGGSRFATQIRADIVPLQTLFVTLFFSSIGMLSNPAWVAANWSLLLLVVTAVVVCKTAIGAASVRAAGSPLPQAVATGMVLAQLGEFSLVLAGVAIEVRVLAEQQFELIVATLMITLFLTPYLARLAPRVATLVGGLAAGRVPDAGVEEDGSEVLRGHLLIIGFGPAGQRIAELLMGDPDLPILVVELNQSTAGHAEAYGLPVQLGDATREEVLEHASVRTARAVAVTLPDPSAAQQVVQQVRSLAPDTIIVVRSRYHVHRWQLDVAGAHIVVDEENEVGARIASEIRGRVLDINGSPHNETDEST